MRVLPMILRTFLPGAAAAVIALTSSCSSVDSESKKPSTLANTGYRSPYHAWPSARNPEVGLPSGFSKSIGITHSRGLGYQPYIAMTFDDGPHATNTPRLLDILRRRNIKATFYVIGENVDRYPHLTRRIVAEGHEIGNHTYTHRNLKSLNDRQVLTEMTRTRSSIIRATGIAPRTMRPPLRQLR